MDTMYGAKPVRNLSAVCNGFLRLVVKNSFDLVKREIVILELQKHRGELYQRKETVSLEDS